MIEDAKISLLKYLTNSIQNIDDQDTLTVEPDLNINMSDFSTADFTVNKIMGVLPAKDIINDIDLLLYYGYGTKTGNNHTVGCIIYCDKDNNFLQLVNTFSSGSEMFCIYDLKINEEKQMYAIGYDAQEAAGVIHTRLLLLENIAQPNQLTNQYEVKLRTSYRLQGTNYNEGTSVDATYTRVIKDYSSASYLIYYRYISLIYMIRFKIVVGGSNEWEDYTTTANYLRSTIGVEWNEENPLITILERDTILQEQINKYYITSSSSTTTSNIDFTTSIQDILGSTFITKASRIAMINSSYAFINFVCNTHIGNADDTVDLVSFRLDYSGNVITNTYHDEVGVTFEDEYPDTFTLYVNNNTQCIVLSYQTSATNNLDLKVYITNYSNGYLVYEIPNLGYSYSNYEFFPILYNIYNLSFITLMIRNISSGDCIADNFKFLYAEDIYSGKACFNKYSLKPETVSLYDNGDSLIFNRDISNIVVQSNSVTSTVNIPNTYLNNETIKSEQLLSKNNNIINEDSTFISKNIYENLYINFINNLTIQDQNTENYKDNLTGANRLLQSAFSSIDYENATMNKYRINYTDNTEEVGNIQPEQIHYSTATSRIINGQNWYTTKEATYNFAIYLSKSAKTLELISNDENTVYQTIDISNLSVGLYSISQHVYIQ